METRVSKVQSSFNYGSFFRGSTVMVIVPHEDDEINTAGATIYGALQEGLRVICVFITNGDWEFQGQLRIQETMNMAREIGIPQEDLIFLGFPDAGVEGQRAVFMHGRTEPINGTGHNETYGTATVLDYSTSVLGQPTPYTWNGLLANLKAVILQYQPSTIISTDFDVHADHRQCAIAVDTVMADILKAPSNTYTPQLLKGFAYATAYETVLDYYESHLLSTVLNRKAMVDPSFSTSNPTLAWEDRIRVPVPTDCREKPLIETPIFKGMSAHVSQSGYKRASRIINGDQVFWEHRTDNLALRGTFTASSGNIDAVNDFLRFTMTDLSCHQFYPYDYLWICDAHDNDKWCRCEFEEALDLDTVVLFGNIDRQNRVKTVALSNDRGDRKIVSLPEYFPTGFTVQLDWPTPTKWIEVYIVDVNGMEAGFSEIELYGPMPKLDGFIQILGNDQFMYDWIVYSREALPQLSLYYWDGVRCRVLTEPMDGVCVSWYVQNVPVEWNELQEAVNRHMTGQWMVIRCELVYTNCSDSAPMWCEVQIRKGSILDWVVFHAKVLKSKLDYTVAKMPLKRGRKRLNKYRL